MYDYSVINMLISADILVQGVLAILVIFSISCWAVIFAKIRLFKRAFKEDDEFKDYFDRHNDMDEIYHLARTLRFSPMSEAFVEAYSEYKRLKNAIRGPYGIANWMHNIERAIEKAVTINMWRFETGIGWLSAIASSSPFIGLFGTVWGIMKSFHEIGIRGSASLATVAPGISEALIATAIGLAAAIPSYIAVKLFNTKIFEIEGNLICFKSELLNRIEQSLVIENLSVKKSLKKQVIEAKRGE